MSRSRIDPQKAAAPVAALREGTASHRRASKMCMVSVGSTQKRLKVVASMDIPRRAQTLFWRDKKSRTRW